MPRGSHTKRPSLAHPRNQPRLFQEQVKAQTAYDVELQERLTRKKSIGTTTSVTNLTVVQKSNEVLMWLTM